VMQRHPGGTAGAVEQRVEERPVGHRVEPSRIASVSWFGLAIEPLSR
jgi:hypothetical protein